MSPNKSTLFFSINMEREADYNKNARGESSQVLTQEQAALFADVLLNGGQIQINSLFPRFLRSLPSGSVMQASFSFSFLFYCSRNLTEWTNLFFLSLSLFLRNFDSADSPSNYVDCMLVHEREISNTSSSDWFVLFQVNPAVPKESLNFIIFSDNVPASSIGSYGVIGLCMYFIFFLS